MNVYIKFGNSRHPYPMVPGTNLGCVRSNTRYQMAIGFTPNDKALLNGVEASDDTVLTEGDEVYFVARSHEKASA